MSADHPQSEWKQEVENDDKAIPPGMALELAQKIKLIYEDVDREFPNKSTAFVLEVTAERVRVQKVKRECDCCDVAEALFVVQEGH